MTPAPRLVPVSTLLSSSCLYCTSDPFTWYRTSTGRGMYCMNPSLQSRIKSRTSITWFYPGFIPLVLLLRAKFKLYRILAMNLFHLYDSTVAEIGFVCDDADMSIEQHIEWVDGKGHGRAHRTRPNPSEPVDARHIGRLRWPCAKSPCPGLHS